MSTSLYLLVVLGKDRPGIIAAVTKALYAAKFNLEDVSMTVLEGELAMFLLVRTPRDAKKRLLKIVSDFKRASGLTFFVKSLPPNRRRGEIHPASSETYLVTVFGKDQTGIVSRISGVLASCRLNITDLNSRILGKGKKAIYALALEVDVPKKFAIRNLDSKLQSLAKKLRVEITLKPVERIEA